MQISYDIKCMFLTSLNQRTRYTALVAVHLNVWIYICVKQVVPIKETYSIFNTSYIGDDFISSKQVVVNNFMEVTPE
jgi:hypothetical protein